jgi:3-methyladenine DNA glycosylase AlkD
MISSVSYTAPQILKRLRSLAHPSHIAGKDRWNITAAYMLGVTIPDLRRLAKEIGKNHVLAAKLWKSGIHEARILAGMIDDPLLVTSAQMDSWAGDFDSWDICDQVCGNLFDKTKFPYKKIVQYSKDEREFVRRTAFTLMATLAVHDKCATDATFIGFFPLIEKYADDDRNFVKKAVNWALRQIGKRNAVLHPVAITCAKRLVARKEPCARWIGGDALKELTSSAVRKRVGFR